ncbi:unnamed protein product [Phytophthora fragariaefolia]|uniref:Unnamed protein product n=1 Tax=Phytophthora fragariaefolia TaxID=1490495 RepID=A0A9W7D3Q9_9STRA|nr:unnamed protein product [Phytophthora fragariaefolia]
MAQYDIGDYVLYADVWQHTRSMLTVKWCGPAQVTATVSNRIFEIENLITGQRREAHASRLKFYVDASMDVSEDLLRHVAHNSEGHVVEELLNVRYNPTLKQHDIEVRWRGLSEAEGSWEPATTLLQDVPTVELQNGQPQELQNGQPQELQNGQPQELQNGQEVLHMRGR